MKPRILTSLSVLLGLTFAGTSIAQEQTPKEIATFAKAPWKVESFAYGDLTGKKTKDAVIMLAKNPDADTGKADDRKLIIALRADKALQQAVESRNAVPGADWINAEAPGVEIKGNSVFISQNGGANERVSYSWQYKLFDKDWRLIGFTTESFDAVDENPRDAKTDVNLLTGYAEASLSKNDKPLKSLKLYEVLSVNGTPPASGEWHTPYVVLKEKKNVESGASFWKGASDLSATIRSYHDANKTLNVQVEVTDDKVTPGDAVTLIGSAGKPLAPTSRSRTPKEGGYVETMQFDLKKAPFKQEIGSFDAKYASSLPFTLKVTDVDDDAKASKVVSTAISSSGTGKHGAILLMPTPSGYTIANVDARNGLVQDALITLR